MWSGLITSWTSSPPSCTCSCSSSHTPEKGLLALWGLLPWPLHLLFPQPGTDSHMAFSPTTWPQLEGSSNTAFPRSPHLLKQSSCWLSLPSSLLPGFGCLHRAHYHLTLTEMHAYFCACFSLLLFIYCLSSPTRKEAPRRQEFSLFSPSGVSSVPRGT